MNSKGTVVTTVNPFGDIQNQIACFNSWKRAGYTINTYNAKKEADLLLKHGFLDSDIKIISDASTTFENNQKYLPRVRPIIEQLARAQEDFILTNSDIYAFHALPLTGVMKSIAPCLAITRREILSLTEVDIRDTVYYRGGLDLFFFSAPAAKELIKEMANCEAADSMAFGIPGWDYLMGALIVRRLNGKICDGAIVGHKYHKNTYSTLDGFSEYARDIAGILNLENSEAYSVAEEFSRKINEHCQKNVRIREKLVKFFHPNGSKNLREDMDTSHIRLTDVDRILDNVNANRLCQVLAKVQMENDWGLANQFIPGCFIRIAPLTSKLFTLWNFLELNSSENRGRTSEYPADNLHSLAIKNCMSLPSGDRDNALLELFATELVNHGIFNKRLFDYFVWSSSNRTQVDILARIKASVGVL